MMMNYLLLEYYLVIYTLGEFIRMVEESLQAVRNILKEAYSGSTIDIHTDPEDCSITLFLNVKCLLSIRNTLLKQEEFHMTWFFNRFHHDILSVFSVSFRTNGELLKDS